MEGKAYIDLALALKYCKHILKRDSGIGHEFRNLCDGKGEAPNAFHHFLDFAWVNAGAIVVDKFDEQLGGIMDVR